MRGYTDTILKYVADESRIGQLDSPDGIGEVGLTNEEAGNRLAVRFTLKTSGEIVETIRFQVFGCGFTIAACAAAAEMGEGRALRDVQSINPGTINRQLAGLPAERSYCAELVNDALQAAVVSAEHQAGPVHTERPATVEDEHKPRINREHPVFQTLITSRRPNGINEQDRQLFAALLTLANDEPYPLSDALGLTDEQLDSILNRYFPDLSRSHFNLSKSPATESAPEINPDVLGILLSHASQEADKPNAELLAWVIAARAAQPGHLWTAMGFFKRPELTTAIRRHLPTLAAANNQGMRWKRYLFKQVCDMNGGLMCKSPNCGDCSDYALCFAPNGKELK